MRMRQVALASACLIGLVGLAAGEDPNALPIDWPITFVDVESGEPIPGVVVRCSLRREPDGEPEPTRLVSGPDGQIAVPLLPGECTFLNNRTIGYWSPGLAIPVGEYDFDGDGELDLPAVEEPRLVKLRRGTVVSGRLLDPEGQPISCGNVAVGVNLSSWFLESKLGRKPRPFMSWDRGQWPNWTSGCVSDDDGAFAVTVPPPRARGYIRLGTRKGGYYRVNTALIEANNPEHVLVKYAPKLFDLSEHNQDGQRPCVVADDGSIQVGDVRLDTGVRLHGRVLDAQGKPLAGVHLYTSSEHGPLAGRTTVSQADGSYRFCPLNPGSFTLRPDATLRDEQGKKTSRDVQAVFLHQEVTLREQPTDVELDLHAVDLVDLDFEWIDRRAQGGPIAYYGTLPVTGFVPTGEGKPTWWRGETLLARRDGREVLTVKAPRALTKATLQLANDSRASTTYEDTNGIQGPGGRVLLGDLSKPQRRVVYADEPLPKHARK